MMCDALGTRARARKRNIKPTKAHFFCAGDACPFRFCLLFWRPHTPGATRGTPGTPGLLAVAAAAALLQVACSPPPSSLPPCCGPPARLVCRTYDRRCRRCRPPVLQPPLPLPLPKLCPKHEEKPAACLRPRLMPAASYTLLRA
mmetsp:Transcript_69094/g.154137  ORF Transcript_69094/g.154137 Transcript_69094/m.154137 type:complete len:144 (-) Transcript_69094:118-549(-)